MAEIHGYQVINGQPVHTIYKIQDESILSAPALDALETPFLVASSQTQITIKEGTRIKVINGELQYLKRFDADTTFAIADKLDAGAIEAGKDYCVYLCDDGEIKVSLNTTFPQGYTADNSRKIGGFHTLCDAVGVIASHTLTGFAAAAILPASVWCLNHRPRCSPAGMVWSEAAGVWVDIYLQSGTGVNTLSALGAVMTDSRNWMDFVDDLAAVGKRLLDDDQFASIADGSNQETNIYGSLDPVTAGKCAPKLFTGAGLNDLTVDRTGFNHAAGAQEYEIEIDLADAVDTVKWRQRNLGGAWGDYTAGVPINVPLVIDGLSFTWAASTGHTLGNKWNFYVMNGLRDTAGRRMVSNIGVEGACGVMYQWLRTPGWRYDIGTPTFAAASQTATIYHEAAPGGNPIYVKYGVDGTPYLCCNMATAADKVLTFGTNYKVVIKHDASAAVGGLPLYFDYDATLPFRFLINNTIFGKDSYAFANDPNFMLPLKHDANAATNGVAVNYDDGADNRLEYISPGAANATMDLCSSGPSWNWYDLAGAKGSLYMQGPYGDIKLLAGGVWSFGAYCGSRCRNAYSYRWHTYSYIGARGCAEPM